jgi:hypothetical protein
MATRAESADRRFQSASSRRELDLHIHRHPCLEGIELKQFRNLSWDTTQLNEGIKLAISDDGPFRYRCRGANSLIPPRFRTGTDMDR